MAHDAKGRLLKEGDIVQLTATVTAVRQGDSGANIDVRVLRPAGVGEDVYAPAIVCNSRTVTRVEA